jgi:hypothetical protein
MRLVRKWESLGDTVETLTASITISDAITSIPETAMNSDLVRLTRKGPNMTTIRTWNSFLTDTFVFKFFSSAEMWKIVGSDTNNHADQ